MPLPEKPQLDPQPSRHSLIPVVLALLAALVIGGGLLVLIFSPFGQVGIFFLLPLVVLCLLAGLHYLVWGRWLTRIIREEEAAEEDENRD